MISFSLLESWVIREASFWILTRRKQWDLGGQDHFWITIEKFIAWEKAVFICLVVLVNLVIFNLRVFIKE